MLPIYWGPHAADFSRDVIKYFLRDSSYPIPSEIEYQNLWHEQRRKLQSVAQHEISAAHTFMRRRDFPIPMRTRILLAHGEVLDGNYMYMEDYDNVRVWRNVEDWLERFENHYALLYVASCNPQHVKLEKKRCHLIYPRDCNPFTEMQDAATTGQSTILEIIERRRIA